MVHKVTDDLLLKIDKLEENNKTVQKELEQIVANCNLLSQLDLEIRALEATVTSLQKEIKFQTLRTKNICWCAPNCSYFNVSCSNNIQLTLSG